jgi:hypothetical protein
MDDRELTSMAVFRLRETAKRLEILVARAQSPALRVWLKSLATQFGDQAQRASLIVDSAALEDAATESLAGEAPVICA